MPGTLGIRVVCPTCRLCLGAPRGTRYFRRSGTRNRVEAPPVKIYWLRHGCSKRLKSLALVSRALSADEQDLLVRRD